MALALECVLVELKGFTRAAEFDDCCGRPVICAKTRRRPSDQLVFLYDADVGSVDGAGRHVLALEHPRTLR